MTDTENTQQPPAPDAHLRELLHGPFATLLVTARDVELGDVVDSTDGFIRVREIVQRPQYVTVAGDPPGQTFRIAFDPRGEGPAPQTRIPLLPSNTIRVRRPIASFGRLAGHSQRVRSHKPVKRGMYTIADGWDAACSCGWKADSPLPDKTSAKNAWLDHKADQLSKRVLAGNQTLALLTMVEQAKPDLPPVGWQFRSITDDGNLGPSPASADLSDLPVEQARAVIAAWRTAPKFTINERYSYDETDDGIVHTMRGPRRIEANLSLVLAREGTTAAILRLSARYTADPFDEQGEAPEPDAADDARAIGGN